MPSSVKEIARGAFYLSVYLDKIIYQDGLEELDEFAHIAGWPTKIILPKTVRKMNTAAFVDLFLPVDFTIKSMDAEIDETCFASVGIFQPVGIPEDLIGSVLLAIEGIEEPTEEIREYVDHFDDYLIRPNYENGEVDHDVYSIICHAGSTAEAYAIEHGIDYELTHFFEGEWNYDWDNLIRWRKCIHCDERETEPLEAETPGGAEIVGPADEDTSFDVEPVSTDYVLIKESLGEMNVVKAFDISLHNQEGVHVQPSGTVKVKLPGDFKTGNYKVYRVNADGTYTDMNAFLQGSHLVFYTDHFSLYVVVDESAQTEPATTEPATQPADDKPAQQNFFQRIIQWFRNLFERIFGIFKR